MRLATLADGRAARVEDDFLLPLPGRVVDHLCRPAAATVGKAVAMVETPLQAPVPRPGKVICVGMNYRDHAKEFGGELPDKPVLFDKASSAIVGPRTPILYPPGETRLDYEAELAVVIGAPAKNVSEEEALSIIGGFACFNDVSARDAQLGDGQWFRGKSHDTFAPFGPWIVTPDEIDDPQKLPIRSLVNGEARQDSNTERMIFSALELVAYCSRQFSLEPGDVIATGTPAGVALGGKPFLQPGDVVTIEIEGIGTLTNQVEAS